MKIVIFGLAVTSSWGNGHATLWRALGRSLRRRGHDLVFFERDQPFYAAHRDLPDVPGMEVIIYPDWESERPRAEAELSDADVAMVTSFCPDARAASDAVLASNASVRCFYDLDTPVTLARLAQRESVPYLPDQGLGAFDLVLSYTGGKALEALTEQLGARNAAALYGSVDPDVHYVSAGRPAFAADLSYLGTYSSDRQAALESLFLRAADRLPASSFIIGGAQYPRTFPWRRNVNFAAHVPPALHPSFYASSPLTLNVTRAPMARLGYCPSARFFEAAACGVPVLSDVWPGVDAFFTPGEEVVLARDTDEAIEAVRLPRAELEAIGKRARERALDEHTADHRAAELERILELTRAPAEVPVDVRARSQTERSV